jgi:hypothetical protein
MILKITYEDETLGQPKIQMNKLGKITEMVFDVPFVIVEKTIFDGLDEQTIPIILKSTKKCRGPCGKEKTRDEFHRTRVHKDGLQSMCIECKTKAARDRQREKVERREALEVQKNETK